MKNEHYSTIHITIGLDDGNMSELKEVYRSDIYTGDNTWKSKLKAELLRMAEEIYKPSKDVKKYDY